MYICALAYAFMTIGGPFLDSQQSFQCVLIVACVIPPRNQAHDWYEALHLYLLFSNCWLHPWP